MPQSQINHVYLPLSRHLNYQTHFIINGDLLETQSGDIIPIYATDMPVSKIFATDKADVTKAELSQLQDFYQRYYLQKFRFTDIGNAQKTLKPLDVPNGVITQFQLVNDMPQLLYLLSGTKIYVDNQIVNDAIINDALQVTFQTPPANNAVITAVIDYDYAVMFDYHLGLQSLYDTKTHTYKISFQLLTV
jgi:hypothetical protein